MDLQDYIVDESYDFINEGIIMNLASMAAVKRMDSEKLLTGILNMYEYICAGDDIKKFYMDYPLKERIFWKNIYTLYQKKVFGIFDTTKNKLEWTDDTNLEGEEDPEVKKTVNDINAEENENGLIEVTPEVRRDLRQIMSGSRNSNSEISPADPVYLYIIDDPNNESIQYVFTINKQANLVRRIMNMGSQDFLIKLFKKMSGDDNSL